MGRKESNNQMISISTNACFQILLIFSLFIMLLYTCNWIEVNKILFTLIKSNKQTVLHFLLDLDKSLEDKNEEEYLMQRLLDLVNQRSNIVDSIDEDRIR